MNIIYSDQYFDETKLTKLSVFLAGPTPRSQLVESWRPKAIEYFKKYLTYDANILIPERSDGKYTQNYDDQVEWEDKGLNNVGTILFWVPRNKDTMPALTTNVEFGRFLEKRPGNLIYGRPDDAHSIKYLDWLYGKVKGQNAKELIFNDLEKMVEFVSKTFNIYSKFHNMTRK